MAWAPGAVLPNCSNTTGVMPLSKACRLYPSLCPYALHLVISSRRSSLATLRSRLTVWIFTSNQSSEPCGSMMCTSALWMGLTLPGAGCPSSWIWSGMSMACSVVAVKPACRASLAMKVSDAVVPAGMEAFGATCGMPPIGVKNVGASLAPRGGAATLLPRARGRESQPLVQAKSENRVKESGLPLAGQAVEPLTVPMVAFRPGRCVTWKVADPLVSQCVT